jgi:hypothetical protein
MPTKKELIALEIARIHNLHDGQLRPREVWQVARADPTNVLHDQFEWDVDRAAEKHWDARAAELIRQSRFLISYGERQLAVPTYLNDSAVSESVYVRTETVAESLGRRRLALEAELARIQSAIRRGFALAVYFNLGERFEELLQLIIEIETALRDEDDDDGDDDDDDRVAA